MDKSPERRTQQVPLASEDIGGVCIYCGSAADSVDHVPPLMVAYMQDDLAANSSRHWLVHACRECNSMLGPLSERRWKVAAHS